MTPLVLMSLFLGQAPAEPGRLPATFVPPPGYQMADAPPRPAGAKPDPSIRLPQPENLTRVDGTRLALRSFGTGWQLWAGATMLRDFGPRPREAQELLGVVRDLQPTHWAQIGSPRPVVEYGLDRGEAPLRRVYGRTLVPIDTGSLRAEAVRGAWVVADKSNVLLNFTTDRAGAEQTVAAIRRYGFNRIAVVGAPNPLTSVLFASEETVTPPPLSADQAAVQRAAQVATLTHTTLDVPGLGIIGERWFLERAQLKVQREAGVWVLAQGPDTLATFGAEGEFAARDALRAVSDGRYTEFCRVGAMPFFLTNGKAPTRVPFGAQVLPFDPARLRIAEVGGNWALADSTGRPLFPAASRDEAERMIRTAQAYGFDAVAQIGSSPRNSLRYLTKTGR